MRLMKSLSRCCCSRKRPVSAFISVLALLFFCWFVVRHSTVTGLHNGVVVYGLSSRTSTLRHDLTLARHDQADMRGEGFVPPAPVIFSVPEYLSNSAPAGGSFEEAGSSRERHGTRKVSRTRSSAESDTRSRRYVLGMNYWEQFNMAVKNYYSLACLANRWDARVVEPYTHNSRLYGLGDVKLDEYFNTSAPAHPLGLIFNSSSFNYTLWQRGLPPAAPLREVLQFGRSEVVFLHFMAVKPTREYHIKSKNVEQSIREGFLRSNLVDCSIYTELVTLGNLIILRMNEQAERLQVAQKVPFYQGQYFCINMNHSTLPSELARHFRSTSGNELTIVVINWRGSSREAVMRTSAKGRHLNNRILMPGRCSVKKGGLLPVNFSQAVLHASQRFIRHLAVKMDRYVAVHIRSEKIHLRQRRFHGLLGSCVAETINTVKLEKLFLHEMPVLFFHDLGRYGTESCRNCKVVRQLNTVLKIHNVTVTNFDPEIFNTTMDSGFVAAVEMETLARAKHLILAGGGAFQSQARMRFEVYHNQSSSYHRLISLCDSDHSAAKIVKYSSHSYPPPPHLP